MEGAPVQEMAAVEINIHTREIIDVFHAYADTDQQDNFSRKHVHGLNKPWFIHQRNTFPSEGCLLATFRLWFARKPFKDLYANAPTKESQSLGIKIKNFNLLPWAERINRPPHKSAIFSKSVAMPILGHSCPPIAHSSFINAVKHKNSLAYKAKMEHGYHCALYDVLELYNEWLMLS